MILDILIDALRSAILISGLVVIMMMLIESLNIDSRGDFFAGLKKSRIWQVVISAFLGVIPGCMGGFATVSLYTHGIVSFGALVAMMVASSGDEAFVLMAAVPQKAIWIFLILFGISIVVGLLTDLSFPGKRPKSLCGEELEVHEEDDRKEGKVRHIFAWKRIVMFLGIVAFIAALLSGVLEEEEAEEGGAGGFLSILMSEEWMYWMFGILSLIVLGVLLLGSDHFVEEHLWHHIICKHLPSVFLWTFGVLLALGFALNYLDIASWINDNIPLMILMATLVGIIPESGPHLVFVTLYAAGVLPMPVLLASCISQDGHASLPLLAQSKSDFLKAKCINCAVALAVGFIAMLFMK